MKLNSLLAALAEAAPGAPQSSEQQLLDVDGTLFIMLGLFALTFFALSRWLWRPYLRVREERVSRVEGYREQAARLEAEAQARLARVEAQLAEARRAGSVDRARLRAEAQVREQAIVAEAQAAAQRALTEARARLETALAAEKARMQEGAATLGREITEKVLGRGVAS